MSETKYNTQRSQIFDINILSVEHNQFYKILMLVFILFLLIPVKLHSCIIFDFFYNDLRSNRE